MRYRVVLFGKAKSGKTQLAQRITSGKFEVKEDSAIIAVQFFKKEIDSQRTIDLWVVTGDKLFNELYPFIYKGSDIGVFCIDLSENINEDEIIQSIESFRQFAPNAPIICVGTKSDSSKANQNALENIKSKELFASFIYTSAKDGDNVQDLYQLIIKLCDNKLISQWHRAVTNLKDRLTGLPGYQSNLLNSELKVLEKSILSDDSHLKPIHKFQSIEKFTNNCNRILEGKNSKVFDAILSVAAAATVLILTAVIGFAMGVALGWWTGPGAFIMGILSGYTAATAVAASSTILGAVAGGVTAYRLFKPSKEIKALNEFTAEVSSWDKAIVL